jgi:hypothetical protein
VGKMIAQGARRTVLKLWFSHRGGYRYHGRVQSLAEGAREGGLNYLNNRIAYTRTNKNNSQATWQGKKEKKTPLAQLRNQVSRRNWWHSIA